MPSAPLRHSRLQESICERPTSGSTSIMSNLVHNEQVELAATFWNNLVIAALLGVFLVPAPCKELRARSALPGIRQNRSRSSGALVAPEGRRIGARAASLWPQTSDLRELTLPLIFVGCG